MLKLGPAWWFHDSPEGMQRYRERVTETAGFFVGTTTTPTPSPRCSARRRRVAADRLSPFSPIPVKSPSGWTNKPAGRPDSLAYRLARAEISSLTPGCPGLDGPPGAAPPLVGRKSPACAVVDRRRESCSVRSSIPAARMFLQFLANTSVWRSTGTRCRHNDRHVALSFIVDDASNLALTQKAIGGFI